MRRRASSPLRATDLRTWGLSPRRGPARSSHGISACFPSVTGAPMQLARWPDGGSSRPSVAPSTAGRPAAPVPEQLNILASREELTPMDKPSFEQLIHEDRAARESKRWRGPFLEYLELVRQTPRITKLSHAPPLRHDHARRARSDILETDDPRVKRLYKDEPVKVYNFFARRVLRHREDDRADRPLLPLRLAEGRGEPPGALPDGPGRLRQELAGRAAAARPRGQSTRSTRSRAARCSRSRCT